MILMTTRVFDGCLAFSEPLKQKHKRYLLAFVRTRHVYWNEDAIRERFDPIRNAVELPLGVNGEFFTGINPTSQDQSMYLDIHPLTKPSRRCSVKMKPDHFENTLVYFANGEMYSKQLSWLDYLIKNFFNPWEYNLNGMISWQGMFADDFGLLVVKNNKIKIIGEL